MKGVQQEMQDLAHGFGAALQRRMDAVTEDDRAKLRELGVDTERYALIKGPERSWRLHVRDGMQYVLCHDVEAIVLWPIDEFHQASSEAQSKSA